MWPDGGLAWTDDKAAGTAIADELGSTDATAIVEPEPAPPTTPFVAVVEGWLVFASPVGGTTPGLLSDLPDALGGGVVSHRSWTNLHKPEIYRWSYDA